MTETTAATPNETRDTKLEIIMGREALDKLAAATVLVLGCGGVGSNCCEAPLGFGPDNHGLHHQKYVLIGQRVVRNAGLGHVLGSDYGLHRDLLHIHAHHHYVHRQQAVHHDVHHRYDERRPAQQVGPRSSNVDWDPCVKVQA